MNDNADTTIMTASKIADMKLMPVLHNIYLKFTKKLEVVSNSPNQTSVNQPNRHCYWL